MLLITRSGTVPMMQNDCNNKNKSGLIFYNDDREGLSYGDDDLKVTFLGTIM
jgi:hypothetical protein